MNKLDSLEARNGVLAVIPAAGSGKRMGSNRPKQFLRLDGKPILAHTIQAFQDCTTVHAIVLVAPPDEVVFCREEVVEAFGLNKVIEIVPGGLRRQDSVRAGLEALNEVYQWVLIHDGVRPLIDGGFIDQLVSCSKLYRAVAAGLPAGETVKEVNDFNKVVKTHDRSRVWLVQTPQIFRYEDLLEAHRKASQEGWGDVTDDASLIERLGIEVTLIRGSEKNIKVTTPYDLAMAGFLLRYDETSPRAG
jgi:2-C-methyl-D-erythritol 4-phosphate cytidylyltransferase